MIDVTMEVFLLRKLLLECMFKVGELAYKNGRTGQYCTDFEKACLEMVLERPLAIDHPEIRGVRSSSAFLAEVYPSSHRVIYPEVSDTHKLVCLPKEDISGIWCTFEGHYWHYLERNQFILWTEKSLDNFYFGGFTSWESLEDSKDPTYPLIAILPYRGLGPNVFPMDSVSFRFAARTDGVNVRFLIGVAKVEECTFYLKEIKREDRMSEEFDDMRAQALALVEKRLLTLKRVLRI